MTPRLTFLPPPPSNETVAEHIAKLIGAGERMTVPEIRELANTRRPTCFRPKPNVIRVPAFDNRGGSPKGVKDGDERSRPG